MISRYWTNYSRDSPTDAARHRVERPGGEKRPGHGQAHAANAEEIHQPGADPLGREAVTFLNVGGKGDWLIGDGTCSEVVDGGTDTDGVARIGND